MFRKILLCLVCLPLFLFAQSNSLKLDPEGIKIRIKPLGRCYLGDLNLIDNEVNREMIYRRQIIATIEPLPVSQNIFVGGTSGQILQLQEVSDVKTILKSEFRIPIKADTKPVIGALYLCKDGAKTGKCSDKKITSFEAMAAEHMIAGDLIDPKTGEVFYKVPENEIRDDRVYFFAPIIIQDGAIKLMSNEKNKDVIKTQITKIEPKNSDMSRDYVLRTMQSIDSMGLTISKDVLEVSLVYNDTSKCYNGGN